MANIFSNIKQDLPTFLTLAALGSTAGVGAAYLNQRFGGGVRGTAYGDNINTDIPLDDKSKQISEASPRGQNKKKKKVQDAKNEKQAGVADFLKGVKALGLKGSAGKVWDFAKARPGYQKALAGGLAALQFGTNNYKPTSALKSIFMPEYNFYSSSPKSPLEVFTSKNMLKPILASAILAGTGLSAYNMVSQKLDRNSAIQSKIKSRIREKEYEDFVEGAMEDKSAAIRKLAGGSTMWGSVLNLLKKKPWLDAAIKKGIPGALGVQAGMMGVNAIRGANPMAYTPARGLSNAISYLGGTLANEGTHLFSIPAAVGLLGGALLANGRFRDKKRDKRVAELKDKIDDVRVKNYVDNLRANNTEEDGNSME